MHDQLLALCRRCGLNPRLGRQLDSVQEALATISTGAAWTLLTATNAPQHTPGVAVRALAETNAHTTVALAWRPTGHSPLTRTFIELAVHARERGELAHPPTPRESDSRHGTTAEPFTIGRTTCPGSTEEIARVQRHEMALPNWTSSPVNRFERLTLQQRAEQFVCARG
jgi:hypothetical protein